MYDTYDKEIDSWTIGWGSGLLGPTRGKNVLKIHIFNISSLMGIHVSALRPMSLLLHYIGSNIFKSPRPKIFLWFSDEMGVHRVENKSHSEKAISLHLYSPAFDECQCFDQKTGHCNTAKVTFWTQFGERTPYVSIFIAYMLDTFH